MIKHLLLAGALAVPGALLATDYFVTPDGNGSKDGSTWQNAMGLSEFYNHMKFVYNSTPVNDSHTGEQFFFSTGTYTFTQTVFFYRSSVSITGGYDALTGELATDGARTVFDGNNQARNNGALFIQTQTERNDAGKSRPVSIKGIDFTNFITKGEWRANETNWQSGRPGAVYITQCGYAEIIDCNFSNNECTGTGDNAMPGALSLNKVNALVRDCSFVGNKGTDGGAVKLYYNVGGTWTKMAYLVVDRCYFADNIASDNTGGAIYGRNSMAIDVINSTFTGNTAANGGAIYNNLPDNYDQLLNIVSSTIAGNSADNGSQIYTNGTGNIKIANSIIVSQNGEAAIVGQTATTGYVFQGNNLIGEVAEGYSSESTDNIAAANTYETVFGQNKLAADGTIKPVLFKAGMAPDAIASIVAGESWNYTVDTAVDQLGNDRSTSTSTGALAVDEAGKTTGIDTVTVDDNCNVDESWYTMQGIRMDTRPTAKGLYIHKGKKVLVQ